METITYENIQVAGIPFSKLQVLWISHAVNEHGRCHMEGEIARQEAENIIQRVDESFALQITTTAEGQPARLFYGICEKISMEQGNLYAKLIIDGVTTSRKLDVAKGNRTFQNTSQTYNQLLNTFLAGKATVQVQVSDKPVGALIMQCEETEWEFAIRMASHLSAPACINIISQMPQLYIGIPPASKTITTEGVSYGSGKQGVGSGEVSNSITGYEYAYLGDDVTFQGKTYRVKSIYAQLQGGILECSCQFTMPAGFQVPKSVNRQVSGRMMTGIVQQVEADKVKVHLNSVDSSYDEGGDWWFPYSTAYSSKDGSGWYSMPAMYDEVRVFFPSGNEGEAFAAGAVAKNARTDVTDKAWRGINGKEILMTQDGIIITCKEGKVYIRLSEDNGIEIISEQNINVTSGANISISAGNTVSVIAENEVIIGTAQSHLNLRKEGISATADNIVIV